MLRGGIDIGGGITVGQELTALSRLPSWWEGIKPPR